jgi:sugar phosphate isomerase/epimerase
MRLSVFTASTPEWTPEEAATQLAGQGWDGVEWRIVDQAETATPGFWAGNRATWPFTGIDGLVEQIASTTKAAGLDYSGIGGYQVLGNRDAVLTMLRVTARLGARRVRVVMPSTDGPRPYPDVFTEARAELAWVADRAAEFGVQALVELHQGTITASASAAIRLVDGCDPNHVGVIHDLGNLVVEGQEDHSSAFQLLGPYLAHVHVKNALWAPTGSTRPDGSSRWGSRWASLRSGQASVRDYLAKLIGHGYDGWLTVEDFSTETPLAERTADNLQYLRSLLAELMSPISTGQ